MLETVEQRNALLAQIEKSRNSVVIAYVLHDNAMVADDAIPQLYDKLQALGKRERIDILLYARNGVIEVCWRVLNLLRDYCDHLGIIVGTRVQGAASVLALGADEIVMGPISELGGMEPARRHPLLPREEMGQPIPITLSEIRALMGFLAEHTGSSESDLPIGIKSGEEVEAHRTAAPSHPKLDPTLLRALFEHVHPLAIANLQHNDTLSRGITEKALRLHMPDAKTERIAQIVDMFNGGFQSPLYTASRAELIEAGLPVTSPDQDTWSAIWALVQLYNATLYSERPESSAPGAFYRYVCMLETVGRLTGLRQTFTQSDGQERILQIRWDTAIRGLGIGANMGPGGRSNN